MEQQLKNAIAKSGLTHYRVGKLAGIGPDQVSRFMDGQDIRISTVNKLCEALGLELSMKER